MTFCITYLAEQPLVRSVTIRFYFNLPEYEETVNLLVRKQFIGCLGSQWDPQNISYMKLF